MNRKEKSAVSQLFPFFRLFCYAFLLNFFSFRMTVPEVFQAFFQRFSPMRERNAIGTLEQGLVQNRVCRTHNLGREFRTVAGTHVAGSIAGILRYSLGEIVPGTHAFVREIE